MSTLAIVLGGVALFGWALAFVFFRRYNREKLETTRLTQEVISTKGELDLIKKFNQESESKFKSIASDILSKSTEDFLKLASERLDSKTNQADGVFEKKIVEFKGLLEPLAKSVKQMEDDLRSVEKQRATHYGQLSEQIIKMSQSSESLRKEASELASALRRPGVKGSWGEFQLKRVVELAGMSAYCDFDEQVQTKAKDNRQRPDMVVRLPNGRTIVVDSKVVSDAFHEALSATDDKTRKLALEKHARDLRAKVVELSRKSYWEQFDDSPEFAVLFVPSESLLYAAVEVDPKLIEDAISEKIVIASPTNLVALLKAVAYGWQQNELTENAENVFIASKDLYERIAKWLDHLGGVGKGLESAIKAYNSSIGSLETRVIPSARRVNDLGLRLKELEAPDIIDAPIREPKVLE